MKRLLLLFVFGIASGALFAQTAGFRQEGIASWYGAEFAGRPTASGEIFDPRLLTAAHPSLPFGTYLKVTNLQNSRQAVVKVNDRGPFVAARIIDLSQGAAELLDIITTGTAPVRIEALSGAALSPQAAPQARTAQPAQALSPAAQPQAFQAGTAQAALSPQAAPQVQPVQALSPSSFVPALPQTVQVEAGAARIIPALPSEGSTKTYRLQVGSYKLPRNAVDAFEKLKSAGLEPAYEQYGELYRVVLAGVRAYDVQLLAVKLGRAGFSEALIREER